jgi:hypothetical protein
MSASLRVKLENSLNTSGFTFYLLPAGEAQGKA